jgi:hypothetical protein
LGWEFVALGLLPERFHLGTRDIGENRALLTGEALHFTETARKFGAGFLGGDFGVDVQEASEVDSDEEDVAEFILDTRRIFVRGGQKMAEFVGFFGEFSKDALDIVPIEPDARGLAGKLVAFEESGRLRG